MKRMLILLPVLALLLSGCVPTWERLETQPAAPEKLITQWR